VVYLSKGKEEKPMDIWALIIEYLTSIYARW